MIVDTLLRHDSVKVLFGGKPGCAGSGAGGAVVPNSARVIAGRGLSLSALRGLPMLWGCSGSPECLQATQSTCSGTVLDYAMTPFPAALNSAFDDPSTICAIVTCIDRAAHST